MSNNKQAALKLKSHIQNNILKPLQYEYENKARETNLRFFTKRDPHMFERVLDRSISTETVKTLFKKLFETNYEYILGVCEKDAQRMNSTDTVCFLVNYKDVNVVMIVFDDRKKDGYFSLMPITIMKDYEYMKNDYEIKLV